MVLHITASFDFRHVCHLPMSTFGKNTHDRGIYHCCKCNCILDMMILVAFVLAVGFFVVVVVVAHNMIRQLLKLVDLVFLGRDFCRAIHLEISPSCGNYH